MKGALTTIIASLITAVALGQKTLVVQVINNDTKEPLSSVNILIHNKRNVRTDERGLANLGPADGNIPLRLSSIGYLRLDTILTTLHADTILLTLIPTKTEMSEVTIVSSTRNDQRIENSPLKVEVLGREEMEEESTIKPAGIGSILGDISGIQIQQSSATSGNANVRIQGLDGRYTQILKDGLPLYDGFSGGFGILSIPPLDLKQVELIKGSASTLYGGGAIGGLVNIISRKPTTKQEAVFSLNQTTLKETNLHTYLSKRFKKTGYTFFGGYNLQKAVDVNRDGFSDVTDLNGLVIHPRLFFYPDHKTTLTLGYTGTFEKRNGGDMRVLSGNTDGIHRFYEKNTIRRNSFEAMAQRNLSGQKKLEFKSSWSRFKRTIDDNHIYFTGDQLNYYAEASLLIPKKTNTLILGLNATGDRFKKITKNISLNDFSNATVGAFIQNTWNLGENTSIESGIRTDHHFTYGNFLLPRLAVFHRFDPHWAGRAGIGYGYKTPNALSPQNTDIPIQSLESLSPANRAEKSIGYNAEVNYKTSWGSGNELFINQAFFLTNINDPLVASKSGNNTFFFSNRSKPIQTKGSDTYIKATIDEWELYAGYTFTIAERKYLADSQFMPLTPKNRFAFTLVREFEEAGIRFGLEGSYTGSQHRDDYSPTPGYFFMAAMMEKKFGDHFSLVLNGENLLDYRQSNVEPLYTGSVSDPSFKSLWAPIDGRVINLSVRWKL